MIVIVIPPVVSEVATVLNGLEKGLEVMEIGEANDTIRTTVEIGQDTEKGPGFTRRFAVSQTPVKYNQLSVL